MKKASMFLFIVIFIMICCSPALAVLKAERIPGIGLDTRTDAGDMDQIDSALRSFAAQHPDAVIDAFQIVNHPVSGTYDIFIMYNE